LNQNTVSCIISDVFGIKETLRTEFLSTGDIAVAGTFNKVKEILRQLEDLEDLLLGLTYIPHPALTKIRETASVLGDENR